jgi:hypothetical protein
MYAQLDPSKLLRALASSSKTDIQGLLPKGPTVTVSRDAESGGEEIAQELAERLKIHCFDRDLLEAIVHQAHVSRELLEELDERVSGMLDDTVRTLMSGRSFGSDSYRSSLERVVLSISAHGGVIVGRGANFVLGARRAFRIRVVGSLDSCAQRLEKRESVPFLDAKQRVQAINEERAQFVQVHFQKDINDAASYDLAINTDRIKIHDAVDVARDMMAKMGQIGRAHV